MGSSINKSIYRHLRKLSRKEVNMQSKKWQFNWTDAKKVFRNAIIFLAPVAITELTLIQQGVTEPREYFIAFQVWGIGVVLDFLRKLKDGK
jgi:hypothetical protein